MRDIDCYVDDMLIFCFTLEGLRFAADAYATPWFFRQPRLRQI